MSNTINLAERWLHHCEAPEKIAIAHQDCEITYAQLKNSMAKLASAFEQIGLQKDSRVIIGLNDSPILHACFLASLAFGAIPIVINPKLSESALTYIIEDSDASIYVSEENGRTIFQFFHQGSKTNKVNYQTMLSYGDIAWNDYFFRDPSDVAFMQYTSGTTGNPKGVMHSSENALYIAQYFAKNTLGASQQDVFYSLAKSFFGYGLGNSLIFPLELQATVVLDSEWPTIDRVAANLSRYQPTLFFGVPAIYHGLASLHNSHAIVSSVRLAISAGSALPSSIFNSWDQQFGLQIVDGLGSTELCHIFCSHTPQTASCNSLGKPLSGYEVSIRDANQQPVAQGETGNLWVKGPSMALGYWKNSAATQSKFVDGWYNSGDLAAIDENGELHFKGRSDDLFKVNGRWVVPSEIEVKLAHNFPTILELALVPYEADDGFIKPSLWVVPRQGVDSYSLKREVNLWCSQNLSSYQRPNLITVIDALPRNDNGKVVRKRLIHLEEVA